MKAAAARMSIALGCVILTTAISALAQDAGPPPRQLYKVDDSGSVVLDPALDMQWQQNSHGKSNAIVSATTRVNVQLNVSAWTGRNARIYMTLPPTSGPMVRAQWTTNGPLLPGSLLSGNRAIVYSGPITSPVIKDIIELMLQADGNRLNQSEQLSFGFEIEPDL